MEKLGFRRRCRRFFEIPGQRLKRRGDRRGQRDQGGVKRWTQLSGPKKRRLGGRPNGQKKSVAKRKRPKWSSTADRKPAANSIKQRSVS